MPERQNWWPEQREEGRVRKVAPCHCTHSSLTLGREVDGSYVRASAQTRAEDNVSWDPRADAEPMRGRQRAFVDVRSVAALVVSSKLHMPVSNTLGTGTGYTLCETRKRAVGEIPVFLSHLLTHSLTHL